MFGFCTARDNEEQGLLGAENKSLSSLLLRQTLIPHVGPGCMFTSCAGTLEILKGVCMAWGQCKLPHAQELHMLLRSRVRKGGPGDGGTVWSHPVYMSGDRQVTEGKPLVWGGCLLAAVIR